MKLVEFSIAEDCIALERGCNYYDLHNCFKFQSLSYNPTIQKLDLFWHRRNGDMVKPTEASELRLFFSGVYLFKAIERDPEFPFTEDDCLDSIGFIWNDMLADIGYTSNVPNVDCSILSLSFVSGLNIKIGAKSADLVVST